ncbi:SDR family NAD(P)-dependent oxidoreductase [Salinarimonas rosea]|uniref:SDR family NAD(P)-dependent oxidoreductase n=1 Tax=Salinarimonas rosea TaxID=552063 RepID=UPI0003FD96A6|nr:SDR family oxidoreductase [Salinarimonas rosea]
MLKDKVAVVYGGSGAIGASLARTFVREGARVFLAARDRRRLESVVGRVAAEGGLATGAVVDVLDPDAVARHAEIVAETAGGIDIVVHAVSFMHVQGQTIDALSLEDFLRPLDLFLRSLFNVAKATTPHLGRDGRGGAFLTFSTPAAKMAVPGHLGYAATCAAKEAFTRTLAAELAPKGVRAICLRPHAIADAPQAGSYTGELFAAKARDAGLSVEHWLKGAAGTTMLGRLPTLADVAEMAAFLASDRAAATTGVVADLSCGALVD